MSLSVIKTHLRLQLSNKSSNYVQCKKSGFLRFTSPSQQRWSLPESLLVTLLVAIKINLFSESNVIYPSRKMASQSDYQGRQICYCTVSPINVNTQKVSSCNLLSSTLNLLINEVYTYWYELHFFFHLIFVCLSWRRHLSMEKQQTNVTSKAAALPLNIHKGRGCVLVNSQRPTRQVSEQ